MLPDINIVGTFMTKSFYVKRIKENFPDIEFGKAELVTDGYDDDVIVLDKKIVFSFPKQKLDCPEKFQRELKFLPLLNKKITLPIPNFIYIPEDKFFAGYNYIAGAPLTLKVFKLLDKNEREFCARQLGKFLSELHNFSVPIAKGSGVEISTMPSDARIKLTVTHQDLIDEHILFDKKSRKISGIIDFGDVLISDPAIDFSRLWSYGEEFIDMILKYYSRRDKNIKERSKSLN